MEAKWLEENEPVAERFVPDSIDRELNGQLMVLPNGMEYRRTDEPYYVAWKETCKALKATFVNYQEFYDRVQELAVLYGDPNAEQPMGVIYASAETIEVDK